MSIRPYYLIVYDDGDIENNVSEESLIKWYVHLFLISESVILANFCFHFSGLGHPNTSLTE